MQNGICIFVANDQNMKSKIDFKLFDPTERYVMYNVLIKIESLQRFRAVFYQNTSSLGLNKIYVTYFWCLTIAQMTEVYISRQTML